MPGRPEDARRQLAGRACQSQNIFKAILLYIDYDKYIVKIGDRNCIGHDLEAAAQAVFEEVGNFKIEKGVLEEIRVLNRFYARHEFRYGSNIDFNSTEVFPISSSIAHRKAVKLIGVMSRLVASERAGLTIRSRIVDFRQRWENTSSSRLI